MNSINIIKNGEYCLVYCQKCGEQAKYLWEISGNIQNYIAYCLLCIQRTFKKAKEGNDAD